MSPRTSPELAQQRYENLPPGERRAAYRAIQSEALKRCGENGLFFAQFVKTRDEADPDNTVKPFPVHYPYIQALWQDWAMNQKSIVAKSRQMLVSWALATFGVWWARRRPNQHVIFQTQSWDDAKALVSVAGGDKDAAYLGRCQFIERSLPRWLSLPIKEIEGSISYPNGSIIEAVPGGADKVRGQVISLYLGDEFAFQTEGWGVWTTLAPLVQKGAKIILVSTPNGAEGNAFYHLYHGTPRSIPVSG